jgi:hypothetical protein
MPCFSSSTCYSLTLAVFDLLVSLVVIIYKKTIEKRQYERNANRYCDCIGHIVKVNHESLLLPIFMCVLRALICARHHGAAAMWMAAGV